MRTIVLFLFLCSLSNLYGQEPDLISIRDLDSSLKTQSIDLNYASSFGKLPKIDKLAVQDYRQIVINTFRVVTTNSDKTTNGNFAALNLKDGVARLNATKNFTNGNMLSVSANGGATNGILSLFNQTKINSNVGAEIKFSLLNKSGSISYLETSRDEFYSRLNKLNDVYKYKKKEDPTIVWKDSVKLLDNEIQLLEKKKNGIKLSSKEESKLKARIEIAKANRNLVWEEIKSIYNSNPVKRDSLIEVVHDIDSDLKQLQDELTFGTVTEHDKILFSQTIQVKEQLKKDLELKIDFFNNLYHKELLAKQYNKERLSLLKSFKFDAIHFNWFSFGAALQNNNFNQFIPSASTLDSQLVKQNYTTFSASVDWNYAHWDHYASNNWFLTISAKGFISDNFSGLDKLELTDVRNYGDSLTTRSTSKKITAYSGSYRTKIFGMTGSVDFYDYLFKNNSAMHYFGDATFKEGGYQVYNVGLGFLHSFQNADDDKTKINLELYFKLLDLSNTLNLNSNLLKRNEFGLRLAVPLNFFNFKK